MKQLSLIALLIIVLTSAARGQAQRSENDLKETLVKPEK